MGYIFVGVAQIYFLAQHIFFPNSLQFGGNVFVVLFAFFDDGGWLLQRRW
jgi:hypothetical protein